MREHVTVVESSVEGVCSVRKNWALMLYEAANPAAKRLLMHGVAWRTESHLRVKIRETVPQNAPQMLPDKDGFVLQQGSDERLRMRAEAILSPG